MHHIGNCCTVDKQERVEIAEDVFQKVNASIKFVSCEPLLENVVFSNIEIFDWLIIGAQRNFNGQPAQQPKSGWVTSLLKQARDANLKVFFRPNLRVGPQKDKPMEYPEVPLPTEST